MGDIIQPKSRALYKDIDSRDSWEAPISLKQFPDVRSEFEFWLDNATFLNKRSILEYRAAYVNVYLHASDTGIGIQIPALGMRSHHNLEPDEEELSST